MKYGIEVGQIYIASDGSKCGHVVTDIEAYADCDDVVTTTFTASGWKKSGNRIDAFKLAMVRYYLVEERPEWMPEYNCGYCGEKKNYCCCDPDECKE